MAVAVVALLALGDGRERYTLEFENAGQLVRGNQVLVAGRPAGQVLSVELGDDFQVRVEVALDEQPPAGTTAAIRAASLSGIANRYVALDPGPGPERLPAGSTIAQSQTQSPVELDQLFDTFDDRTRAALRRVISGQATVYRENPEGANRTYRFFAPALTQTRLTFAELERDSRALAGLIADGASVAGAVGERGDELSSLVSNAGLALRAVANRDSELDRAISAAPAALRQANTTFVNLRGALDDLDPLVVDAKRSTRDLTPFLAALRPVAEDAVPVFADLRRALRSGRGDLTGALRGQPALAGAAASLKGPAITALDDSEPVLEFVRPYSPDLVGWLAKFGQITAYYDANGHYARVMPAASNLFGLDGGSGALSLIPTSDQFDGLVTGVRKRCPGGSTQPIAGSNPFLDDGALIGACNPADVPPGP